jgi:hypothetical protein
MSWRGEVFYRLLLDDFVDVGSRGLDVAAGVDLEEDSYRLCAYELHLPNGERIRAESVGTYKESEKN